MMYRQLRTPRSIVGGSIVCGLLASGIAHGQPAKPALEAYVGSYELTTATVLTVTLEGESLYAQTTGEPKHRLVPVSAHRFSYAGSKRS